MRRLISFILVFAAVAVFIWCAKLATKRRRAELEFQQLLHIQALVVLIEGYQIDQSGSFPGSLAGLRSWARSKEEFQSVATNDAIWTYQSPFSGRSEAWCITPPGQDDMVVYAPFEEAEYDQKRLVGFSRTVSPFVRRMKITPPGVK